VEYFDRLHELVQALVYRGSNLSTKRVTCEREILTLPSSSCLNALVRV
jgi:hypothetical protein